jgi:fucose permease
VTSRAPALVVAPTGASVAGVRAGRSAAAEPPPAVMLAAFGGLLLLYSGSEAAIGGWIAEHARRLGAARWPVATTLFWLAITVGRLTTPLVLPRLGERRVLAGGLTCAMTGALAVALAPAAPIAFVAVVLAGLGLAPVFPVTFGALTRDVGPSRPRLVGPLYSCTGVGSALLPRLVGVSSTAAGSLRVGLLVPFLGTVGLLALSVFRLSRQPAGPPLAER